MLYPDLSPTQKPLWKTYLLSAAGCLLVLFGYTASTAQLTTAPKITTVAGGFSTTGLPGTSSTLQEPVYIAIDSKGNLYITDRTSHRIRKLSTAGILTTFAGTGIAGFNSDGLVATKTLISFPEGIVVDSMGDIIFCDAGNNRIRMIRPSKLVTTIAGTGVAGFNGDNIPATAAMINSPAGLSSDAMGNLYFADVGNQRVRKIDLSGNISTLAGTGVAGFNGDGIPANTAKLNSPQYALSDNAGNVFIADSNNGRVRKVDASGTITTLAGNGQGGCGGDGGPATSAQLGSPGGLQIFQGKLYVSTFGCSRIRAVDLATGVISLLAGSTPGFDGSGHDALSSQFFFLGFLGSGILVDSSRSRLLIADGRNALVRELSFATNVVTVLAGGYIGDGLKPTRASLNLPDSLAFDSHGNMYIEDSQNNRIRKMTPAGATSTISTFAGTGISGYNGDGIPAASAQLNEPRGIAIDQNDNIYIADTMSLRIRKIDPAGTITTVAQSPDFRTLVGLTVDPAGNLYVADAAACVVWQITGGTVSIFAGVLNSCGYNGEGTATSAKLFFPWRVALDTAGNLFIADTFNNRVRKVSGGLISTIVGTGTCDFAGDGGPATSAALCAPTGIATDSRNNVYVSDAGNGRVREISAGTINTIGGTGTPGFNGNGLAALATNLDGVDGLVITSRGVFVADTGQDRVRKIH